MWYISYIFTVQSGTDITPGELQPMLKTKDKEVAAKKSVLTLEDLLTSCAPGGGTSMRILTDLAPAGGVGAVIAPARVVDRNEPTYACERRMEINPSTGEAESIWVVMIDHKQSMTNRAEDAVQAARREKSNEGEALRSVPTVEVQLGDRSFSDLSLPHRVFDGHIRSSSLNGIPVTQTDEYRALRNATKLNARPLLDSAPTALIFGAWDSTRKSNQGRYQTCLTGEIVGVLADQDRDPRTSLNRKAAGRIDPVAASVKPDQKTVEALVADQAGELSDKLQDKILRDAKKKGAAGSSMSTLGLGNVPPALGELGGVSCRSIIRRNVLSFSALRQLRFGGTPEADVACRALLAAYGLLAMSLADRELYLRANCDLVELSQPEVTLDLRYGNKKELEPITPEIALGVFNEALAHAQKEAGVDWSGQVMALDGNPAILGSLSADEPEA